MIHIKRVLATMGTAPFFATGPGSVAQDGTAHDVTCEYGACGCHELIVHHGYGIEPMDVTCDSDG
jgi:hypothetical protein